MKSGSKFNIPIFKFMSAKSTIMIDLSQSKLSSVMVDRILKGLFNRHTCQRSTVIATPHFHPKKRMRNTLACRSITIPVSASVSVSVFFFLSYPFFPLPFTFFDKCHTPRVKCVFQHLPLSSRGKLSHFLGILWCSILPRICPYRRLAGVTAGKVSWQPLLGPVIVPERFFVARLLCRAMPARGCGGDSPELVQILFSFFFYRQASL